MLPSFGADTNGLICGYRFVPDRPAVAITLEEALAFLQAPTAAFADTAAGFIWLHFNLTHSTAEPWMREHLRIAPEYFDAMHAGSRSTRIEDADDALIAVVNDVAFEFEFDATQTASLWLFADSRMAVTARVHPLRTLDRLRQDVRDGWRCHSPVAFLVHLLQQQGDVLVRIVREATLKIDSIEDGLLVGRLPARRAELGRLRRVMVRLRRLLAPEPAAMFRLLRAPPPWVGADDVEQLRQATEEFSLVIRDMTELQERIKLLQEEIAAEQGERTGRSLYTLTIVTVLALPINIITGMLGMNVGGIPMAQAEHGFAVIATLVAAFTGLAAWLVFRRND